MVTIIQIIKVPPGEAPLWVREALVGLVFPAYKVGRNMLENQTNALGGPPGLENLGGFKIFKKDAMTILDLNNKKVADWCKNDPLIEKHDVFVFDRKFCKITK